MTAPPATKARTAWTLADWANHLAADFRTWEATTTSRGPRDEAIVWHVLALLADPDGTDAAELGELLDRIRAGQQEVAW